MFFYLNRFSQMLLCVLVFQLSSAGVCDQNEFNTTKQLNNVPGESIANAAPLFMKRFQESLLEYSQRAHHCSNPAVIETRIMHFSSIDTSQEIPIMTGPIHEQWKILACGNKFYYYVGVAPDEQDHSTLVFAAVFKESDW